MQRRAIVCSLVFLAGLCGLTARAADVPGTHFDVEPANMPKPYATLAVDNSPQIVARPKNAVLKVPRGFTASLFAGDLAYPRWMAVAPNGDVFVAESRPGTVTVLRDSHGTGRADLRATFASGFHIPHGIAFHGGALYVGDIKAVWRIPYTDGALKGGKPERITKAADLGIGGTDNHVTRDIAFGPDGTLYLAIGSNANVEDGEPEFRASVQTVNPDGTLSTFASGLRNAVGIAFYPGTNRLWVSVNERDGMGDGLVPDYLTHLEKGAFYGWPYAYIGRNPDPVYGRKRPDLVAKTKTPDLLFQSHSAPTGLVFYDGKQFPAAYRGDAFVSLHGSWNSSKPTGYKVVRVHFADGKPVGGYDNFVTGFWDGSTSPAKVWGRPAGLVLAKDGSLLIADETGKAVWRVAYTGR